MSGSTNLRVTFLKRPGTERTNGLEFSFLAWIYCLFTAFVMHPAAVFNFDNNIANRDSIHASFVCNLIILKNVKLTHCFAWLIKVRKSYSWSATFLGIRAGDSKFFACIFLFRCDYQGPITWWVWTGLKRRLLKAECCRFHRGTDRSRDLHDLWSMFWRTNKMLWRGIS